MEKRKKSLLLGAALVSVAAPAMAQRPTGRTMVTELWLGREVVAGEALVRLRGDRATAAFSADIAARRSLGDGRYTLLRSRGRTTVALLRDLSRRGDIVHAEPNFVIRLQRTPNDTHYATQWGLFKINAASAWDVTVGGTESVVGIVDSGIDYNHPDLAANLWTAPRDFPVTLGGVTRICPAGSHGYNALNDSFDPMDDNNHGTHCAGIVGAVGNDGYNIPGVCWTTRLMGLKFIDAGGQGTTADAIDAIEFAVQARQHLGADASVRVLSNSWGVPDYSQALADEIARADANEILFVSAAGNSYSDIDLAPSYPASYASPNQIAVAATDANDGKPAFSNWGVNSVHLGAPGYQIISTTRNGGYATYSGTSMAAPHVAGVAALMLSLDPNLSVAELKSGILSTVDPIASLAGITVTGGRLNADRAVRSVVVAPNFRVDAAPVSVSVPAGASTPIAVRVTGSAGFADAVAFRVDGLPAGTVAAFAPDTLVGGGDTVLTLSATRATVPGVYPVVLVAQSAAGRTHTTTLSVEVLPAPDFTLDVAPGSVSAQQGAATAASVTIGAVNGFGDPVGLSVTGLPAGVAATFSPASVTGAGVATLTLTLAANATPGDFPLSVVATSGAIVHSAPLTLSVVPAADFALAASPTSRTIQRGNSTSYRVSVAPLGGFKGAVLLSVAGAPSGVSASVCPTSVAAPGSASVTVKTTGKASPGTYVLTLLGVGGGRSHALALTLTIRK